MDENASHFCTGPGHTAVVTNKTKLYTFGYNVDMAGDKDTITGHLGFYSYSASFLEITSFSGHSRGEAVATCHLVAVWKEFPIPFSFNNFSFLSSGSSFQPQHSERFMWWYTHLRHLAVI
jgi:hypothetical protein